MSKTIEERVAELEAKIGECATHADLQALKEQILSESAAIVAQGTKNLVKGFFGHIVKAPVAGIRWVKTHIRKAPKAEQPAPEPQVV